MMLLVPLDLVCPGSLMSQVSDIHAVTCFSTIVVTAVAVIGQLYNIEKRILLLEPDALLMTILIVGALYLVYVLSSQEEERAQTSMAEPQRHVALGQYLPGNGSQEELAPGGFAIGAHHQQRGALRGDELAQHAARIAG
jgi:hypothetical protein